MMGRNERSWPLKCSGKSVCHDLKEKLQPKKQFLDFCRLRC